MDHVQAAGGVFPLLGKADEAEGQARLAVHKLHVHRFGDVVRIRIAGLLREDDPAVRPLYLLPGHAPAEQADGPIRVNGQGIIVLRRPVSAGREQQSEKQKQD